jgi:hypothetical protein
MDGINILFYRFKFIKALKTFKLKSNQNNLNNVYKNLIPL